MFVLGVDYSKFKDLGKRLFCWNEFMSNCFIAVAFTILSLVLNDMILDQFVLLYV